MKRGRPMKCPYCASTAIIAKGYRKTVTLGMRQLRLCKNCQRRFTKGSLVESETMESIEQSQTNEVTHHGMDEVTDPNTIEQEAD